MRRPALPVGGWIAAVCLFGTAAWSCSEDATNLFDETSGGGASGTAGTETGGGGSAGSSTGGTTGGLPTGGSSGSSTGGGATGGTPTGGTTGDGGAAAESGSDAGGTTTGGSGGTPSGAGAGGSNAGSGGTPGMGGAGVGGTLGGAGAGAGMGGGGMGGGGKSGGKAGSGGAPGSCQNDANCNQNEYCKKATCDAPSGSCTPRGPECRGANAEFEPVCGCDGITYWNTCAIEHEGFNVALHGECTGNNRPTCTRDAGGDSCPERANARCYRPVDECGTTSPTMGVCWVLPAECPANEAQTQRYCGGTAGSARCIGFCEVIEAENSFQRDAERCAN